MAPKHLTTFFVLQKQILRRNANSSPLTSWQGALPLDAAGGSAPDPRYRFALRGTHHVPQTLTLDPPVVTWGYWLYISLRQWCNVLTGVRMFVCLSLSSEQNCTTKTSQAIFVKRCRIIDYCYEKESFNFRVDPTQNARIANIWISVIIYCILLLFIYTR